MFRLLFLLTLAPAVWYGFRRGGDFTVVAIVLTGSWALSWVAWPTVDPILTNAMSDLLCAAFIAILCSHRACLFVGLLFGAVSSLSIIYGLCILPSTTYSLAYAHAVSIGGHLQNLVLLFGATDAGTGRRLRDLGAAGRRLGLRLGRVDLEDRAVSREVNGAPKRP